MRTMARPIRTLVMPAAASLLLLGACGSSGSSSPTTTAAPAPTTAVAAGEPADPATATRTVDISIVGTAMAFEPQNVQVEVGEVVNFAVANDSDIEHELTLGDETVQTEHEEEMQSHAGHGGAMADDANSIVLPPHSTKSITWKFTSPGTVVYGCHVVGHYAAGMKGTVEVTA